MCALNLSGTLNLMGTLTLAGDGGKVTVDGKEILVEIPIEDARHAHGTGAPVILPPPPAGPTDPGANVKIFKSFNSTVKVGEKKIVAMGLHLQGDTPIKPGWPGMVLPGSKKVTINRIPINVQGDKGITLPNGGSVEYSSSGQE